MQAATQTWGPAIGATDKWCARCMPCLTDLAFVLPIFFLFGRLSGTKILFGDGDTGWQIRTGEWILSHRAVPTEDFFSFTKLHHAWFAWEWGWDLLFAVIHKFWGLGGVAFVNVMILGVISVLLYKLALRASGNELASFFVTTLAICGSSSHWLARPHLLSWLLFLLFLHLIRDLQEGRRRALYLLPAVAVVWANVHPSFFVGPLLLFLATVERALQQFIDGRAWLAIFNKCRPLLWTTAICSLVSLLNPYTWRLYVHIFVFLYSGLANNMQEYQPVNFHKSPAGVFECMLLLGTGSVFWSLRWRSANSTVSILFWSHMALLAIRNVPLFLMIAAPATAKMLSHIATRSTIPRLGDVQATISQISKDIRFFERRRHVHALAGLATIAVAGLFASGAPGFEGQFSSSLFPVTAVPTVAASRGERIFASDQWGAYLIYRLYPAKKVFVDDRVDLYGRDLSMAAGDIQNARNNWRYQLNQFAVDMVIIKPDAPLAAELKVSPGWVTLFDDGKAIVFQAKLSRMQKLDPRTDRRS